MANQYCDDCIVENCSERDNPFWGRDGNVCGSKKMQPEPDRPRSGAIPEEDWSDVELNAEQKIEDNTVSKPQVIERDGWLSHRPGSEEVRVPLYYHMEYKAIVYNSGNSTFDVEARGVIIKEGCATIEEAMRWAEWVDDCCGYYYQSKRNEDIMISTDPIFIETRGSLLYEKRSKGPAKSLGSYKTIEQAMEAADEYLLPKTYEFTMSDEQRDIPKPHTTYIEYSAIYAACEPYPAKPCTEADRNGWCCLNGHKCPGTCSDYE